MHLAYGLQIVVGQPHRTCMRRDIQQGVFPVIISLHQGLAETGSFERASRNRVRTARTPPVELNVLQQVLESTSTQSLARTVGVSCSSVWRILREHNMHPFHMQRVQGLQPEDYAPRIAFAHWYLGMCATDPLFPAVVLFSDEASFTREGIFNTHNAQVWAEENPHVIRRRAAQTRFSVNVCAGIIGDHLIEPYLLLFYSTYCHNFCIEIRDMRGVEYSRMSLCRRCAL